jgi:3-hydroxybutyryl-CoA dehydrogenase
MKLTDIKKIAVLGLGTMGPGISQAFAQAGYEVMGFDLDPKAAEKSIEVIKTNLKTLMDHQLLSSQKAEEALNAISIGQKIQPALSNADLVVECVSENREIKSRVFEQVALLAKESALVWSNTSTLDIYGLLPTALKQRSLIAHFFAPPHIIPLVEVVKGPETPEEIIEKSLNLLKKLDKIPIVIQRYLPGFIINRILRNLGREAFFLLDEGYISMEDLDLAVKASIAPRMMVLGLIQRYDFTGLDLSARNLLDEEFFDPPVDNKPKALHSRIEKGDLGVKTGRGFFDYQGRDITEINRDRDDYLLKVMEGIGFCLEKKRLV